MQAAQAAQKRFYDAHHRFVEYQVGEQVLLSTEHLQLMGSCKLLPRFVGPCTVTERVGQVSYRLAPPEVLAGRIFPVFHVSKLRKYQDHGGDETEPV